VDGGGAAAVPAGAIGAAVRLLVRLARVPALHFVLIGGTLFLLAGRSQPGATVRERRTIVLGAADVARLRSEWAQQHGAPPGPAEEAALVVTAIDEEVLHREALALGLDRNDPLVRARLVQLARYLEEGPVEDEEALERDARALGLDRTDVVLRRYLVQGMRLLAAGPRGAELPAETELQAYLDRHGGEFAQPSRVRLSHVYLSAERRPATLERDARALLARLRSERVSPERAAALGDPFVRGSRLPPAPEADLERTFGPGFAAATRTLPPEAWSGPVPSTYGLHLLWVHERTPARVPALAEVRGQVLHRVLRERREERVRQAIAGMHSRYEIRVAGR
jgi:hypothetical protein